MMIFYKLASRNVLALALIPPEEVRRALQLIAQNTSIEVQAFLAYFAQNYIGLTWRQQQEDANAFPPADQAQTV